MLLSSDTKLLSDILHFNQPDTTIKGGSDSVRSKVTKLNDHVPGITHNDFVDALSKAFYEHLGHEYNDKVKPVVLDESILKEEKVKELYDLYRSYKWRYASSPPFSQSINMPGYNVTVRVTEGRFVDLVVETALGKQELECVMIAFEHLKGRLYCRESVLEVIRDTSLVDDRGRRFLVNLSEFVVDPEMSLPKEQFNTGQELGQVSMVL
jgi:hypothetical protein